MRVRELKGRPVLDVAAARELGRVEAVIVDPAARAVIGFRVSGASPVLPLAEVKAVGADAVTVDGPFALHLPNGASEERSVAGALDPVGLLVLGDDGNALGRVADLDIDEASGAVVTIFMEGHDVDGQRLLGLGRHALVVRSA